MPENFPPALGSTLSQLESHRETGFGTAVAFRFTKPQTDRGECAFDRIFRTDVTPVLRREIKERQQHVTVVFQTSRALVVLRFESILE
jgi:hypothetical protein